MLIPFVDIVLLVVRQNYTSKDVFENVMGDLTSRKIERVNIVLNDVEISKNRYGYGYNYGYAYASNSKPLRRKGRGKTKKT